MKNKSLIPRLGWWDGSAGRITAHSAGEIVQWLRVLAAFSEDLGSYPSTHVRQPTTAYNSSSRRSDAFSGLFSHQTHQWCTDVHASETLILAKWKCKEPGNCHEHFCSWVPDYPELREQASKQKYCCCCCWWWWSLLYFQIKVTMSTFLNVTI